MGFFVADIPSRIGLSKKNMSYIVDISTQKVYTMCNIYVTYKKEGVLWTACENYVRAGNSHS